MGKRELILVLFVHLLDLCLFGFVSSSSWCLGRAVVCDCGTPWTFLLPFFLTIREQMRLKIFKDGHLGSHLRYQTRTILAILNLYVTMMPPIKFGLNPHYGMGGSLLKNFKMAPMVAILDVRIKQI